MPETVRFPILQHPEVTLLRLRFGLPPECLISVYSVDLIFSIRKTWRYDGRATWSAAPRPSHVEYNTDDQVSLVCRFDPGLVHRREPSVSCFGLSRLITRLRSDLGDNFPTIPSTARCPISCSSSALPIFLKLSSTVKLLNSTRNRQIPGPLRHLVSSRLRTSSVNRTSDELIPSVFVPDFVLSLELSRRVYEEMIGRALSFSLFSPRLGKSAPRTLQAHYPFRSVDP